MITVKVKCVCCGSTKDIKPGEVARDNMPMCDKCFSPMVAVKASSR